MSSNGDLELNNNDNASENVIDLKKVFSILWSKKTFFIKLWGIVFILSCIWILPEPRYYTSEVSLAPESTDPTLAGGGLSSIASNFGINLGGMNNSDAIYPMLYPDLFESPEFVVSLFDIAVKTEDGEVDTDYYTYLKKHQKKNALKQPFKDAMRWAKNLIAPKKKTGPGGGDSKINPFFMSEDDYGLTKKVMDNIICSHDKKTDVITITVRDQDRLVSATVADSVMHRLQNFITMYRTSKSRMDLQYYQHLTDSARIEFDKAADKYGRFCDSHKDAILQTTVLERDKLETEMSLKLNSYTAMQTQLQAMKAKVQEKTPAFTILKSATVPIKPAGPKRMIFVLGMLILSTMFASLWLVRKEIHFTF